MSTKPMVDRLEAELKGNFTVIRLDVGSKLGTYAREKYGGGFVPLFLVINSNGEEVFRHSGSVPKPEKILSLRL